MRTVPAIAAGVLPRRRLGPLGWLAVQMAREAARRRHWRMAAWLYERIVTIARNHAPLWVQLGHAARELERAEAATRAYILALFCDPANPYALREAVRMGALDAARTVLAMQGVTAPEWLPLLRLEAAGAGPMAQLCAADHVLTPPEARGVAVHVVVLDQGQGSAAVCHSLQALAALPDAPGAIILASSDTNLASLIEARTGVGCIPPDCAAIAAWLAAQTGVGHAVLMHAGSAMAASLPAWVAHIFAASPAAFAIIDEVVVGMAAKPWLKAAADPWLLEAGISFGTLLAARHGAIATSDARDVSEHDPIHSLLRHAVAAAQPVAHLPLLLGEAMAIPALPATPPVLPELATRQRLGVIIPTRDGLEDLVRCLDSLEACAVAPQSIDIVIVDNGSQRAAMRDFLAAGAAARRFAVVHDPAPFNWSRLNNLGIAACAAELLLLLNDDIEFLATGWDDVIRTALADPRIGAVGGRLLYPDGTVQHAGIVLRPGAPPEHDGRFAPADAPGPMRRWLTPHLTAAVTGACMAVRREDLLDLGGLDETLPVWCNDIDLCLRLRRHGQLILFQPALLARHYESRSIRRLLKSSQQQRGLAEAQQRLHQRWGAWMTTDPGHDPHFSAFSLPFACIGTVSGEAAAAHLRLTATAQPWQIPVEAAHG